MNKYLSNIELYYSTDRIDNSFFIKEEEKNHITRVMRHSEGEKLFVTNGKGFIFSCSVNNITSEYVKADIIETFSYNNDYKNIYFCIPKLKSPERFEFALEKCTELGITNFLIYDAMNSVSRGSKLERWDKIITSAMKQSLRSYKPEITIIKGLSELNSYNGAKIILDQEADEFLNKNIMDSENNYFYIFGPESGLNKKEIESVINTRIFKISPNRLRTETAIIKTASLITF